MSDTYDIADLLFVHSVIVHPCIIGETFTLTTMQTQFFLACLIMYTALHARPKRKEAPKMNDTAEEKDNQGRRKLRSSKGPKRNPKEPDKMDIEGETNEDASSKKKKKDKKASEEASPESIPKKPARGKGEDHWSNLAQSMLEKLDVPIDLHRVQATADVDSDETIDKRMGSIIDAGIAMLQESSPLETLNDTDREQFFENKPEEAAKIVKKDKKRKRTACATVIRDMKKIRKRIMGKKLLLRQEGDPIPMLEIPMYDHSQELQKKPSSSPSAATDDNRPTDI